jgi:DNA-binding CsgD family transcriptional regulator
MMAHVLPVALTTQRRMPAATAMVLITPNLPPPTDVYRSIAAMYGLTASEQRIAAELARGETPTRAAATPGISDNTVKTHITRIYAKTGVSRHAELVALYARMAPPLR